MTVQTALTRQIDRCGCAMGCNCTRKRIEVYEVEFVDGTVKRVLTLGEVRDLQDGGNVATYRKVTR